MRASVCACLAMLTLSLGCNAPRTELLVLVDTDLGVPGEVDRFRVQILGPNDALREADAPLSTPEDRPRWLGVVHHGGPLGPLDVRVTGLRGTAVVIERRAVTSFVAERTVTLRMSLLRSCLGASCADGQTCAEAGCRSVDVPPEELTTWSEPSDRLDAGTSCGPETCNGVDDDCDDLIDEDVVAQPETCNGIDDDCDGTVDNGFDLTSDPLNCGTCGFACEPANGTGTCMGSVCVISTCTPPFDDCDGSFTNGCEANTDTNTGHCGTCDNACRGSTRECCAGSCMRSCI